MVDPGRPIPSERALSLPDVSKGLFTKRVVDKEAAAVESEAAGPNLLAQSLTLEAMSDRLEVLEPFIIGTAQEEAVVKSRGTDSDEASANVPIDSSFLSTDCVTATENSSTACPGPVLGQERRSSGDQQSFAAYATPQSLKTTVASAGSSSTICDGSPVTNSDVPKEELDEKSGCSRPLAGTTFEGQESGEANAIIHPTDVQSALTQLPVQDFEVEKSTPDPASLFGSDERPRDRTMLDCSAESVEAIKAHHSTQSPPVRSRRGRSSSFLTDKDNQDYGRIPIPSKATDLVPSKTNEGRLESAGGVVCGPPGKRRKQPGTKRKRVARSENVASKHVGFISSAEGHGGISTSSGMPDVPPPPIAGPSQKSQRVSAGKNVQQNLDIDTKAQLASRDQAFELLQSSISEARAQAHGKKARHDHAAPQRDRRQQGTKPSASEQTQGEGMERKRENWIRAGETPLTQTDEKMGKSKRKRMKARPRFANQHRKTNDDDTKRSPGTSRAEGCLAIESEHERGPPSALGEEVIASVGSTPNAKERLPRKRHHPGRVSAPIKHVNGSSDASSKAVPKDYDGMMAQESEDVLAPSGSRRENSHSHINSTQHRQLSSTIPTQLNPIIHHTESDPRRLIETTGTTPAQASRRRRRANKTSTASGHRPGAGGDSAFAPSPSTTLLKLYPDKMSTSRGSVPGARGRSHLRSSHQDGNAGPGPWPSRAPSVTSNSTSRRPRGFQPAEVGKCKPNTNAEVTPPAPPRMESVTQSQGFVTPQRSMSSIEDEAISLAPPKAEAITQPKTSATIQSPPNVESSTKAMQATNSAKAEALTAALLAQSPEKQSQVIAELLAKATPKTPSLHQREAQPSPETTMPGPLIQTVGIDASRPEFDPFHVESNDAPSPSESSSIQIITDDEPRQSCWSRAVTTEAAPPPKSGWDNSTNPIDNPSWTRTRSSILPTPDYKGPVAANLRNLPAYKLIGSKNGGVAPTSKKSEITQSASFSRQMASIQQAILPSQPPRTPQPQTPVSVKIVDGEAAMTPELKKPSVPLTTSKGTAKVPPHLRAQGTSPNAGESKENHSDGIRAPHLRQSVCHSEASNDHNDINAGKETIAAATTSDIQPTHLQGQTTKKLPPVSDSALTADPSNHQVGATSPPSIDIDEELAAAEHVAETENDAQIAAAIAAGDPHGDQQFAADLQAGFDDEQLTAKHIQMGMGKTKSEGHADTLPPHLRASRQKQNAPLLDTKPQNQSPAAVQSATIPQDNYTIAIAPHSSTLKDVTKLRQNGKVRSSSREATLPNGTQSAVKKGKKPANGSDSGNGPSHLMGWDGKMVPALLGEDWEIRAQHGRQGQEKLAVVKTWTEDHAVNPGADVIRVEDKLMSPISIKHPLTKPNPDEFNQAKRHLITDDHIQAYKAKHSSSLGNTTPSSRGRMSKEEKRDARKRHAEEERNRVYPPNEHAPAANIYLRPAEFKDMRQVCFLHSHYVLKTACAHDLEETNELYWRQRLQETIDEGDPFLVAVHMGSKPINNIRDVHRKRSETIVGFAFAADYGLQTHAYRFTVEVEVWVHRDHLRQGIGRSMLDRMLAALDPGYNLLECAPFLGGEQLSRWVSGSHCLVKTILVNILHNEDSKDDVEWKKNWLSNKNDFKYCGTLPGIGHKFGKDVDIAQMILRTSASMPASPIS